MNFAQLGKNVDRFRRVNDRLRRRDGTFRKNTRTGQAAGRYFDQRRARQLLFSDRELYHFKRAFEYYFKFV